MRACACVRVCVCLCMSEAVALAVSFFRGREKGEAMEGVGVRGVGGGEEDGGIAWNACVVLLPFYVLGVCGYTLWTTVNVCRNGLNTHHEAYHLRFYRTLGTTLTQSYSTFFNNR